MHTLDSIREALPGYARDLALNLGSVLTVAGAPGLSERQIWAVALASAVASGNAAFSRGVQTLAAPHLDAAHVSARARGGGRDGDEQRLLPLPAPGGG